MSEHHPHESLASDTPGHHASGAGACAGGCDAIPPDRRAFLRASAAAVAAVLLGLGARTADALVPLAFTSPRASRGQTRAYAIPAKDGAEIDRDNEVILVRWQNALYGFSLACPHQNTALRWEADEGQFRCPKHKSTYKPDGSFIQGRATRGMDRFSVKREGNGVVVDLDAVHEQDTDPKGWDAALVKLA
jgi:nitrite reductase/ring-hydroxylating ferredoxin subunit